MNLTSCLLSFAILVFCSPSFASSYWYYSCESADKSVTLYESRQHSYGDYHAGSNKPGEQWTVFGTEYLIPTPSPFRDIQAGKFGIKTRTIKSDTCLYIEELLVQGGVTLKFPITEKIKEIDYLQNGEWKQIKVRLTCRYFGDVFNYCRDY